MKALFLIYNRLENAEFLLIWGIFDESDANKELLLFGIFKNRYNAVFKIIKIKTEKIKIYYCSNFFTAINHNAYCIVVVFVMEKLSGAIIMRYKYRT
jgi:hypothetical protein